MDISSLLYANSPGVINMGGTKQLVSGTMDPFETVGETGGFEALLDTAIKNFNLANAYQSEKEDMELKWAMGEVDNPHDLTIALSKATQALNYTTAIRDRLLEAYREIMQMQI